MAVSLVKKPKKPKLPAAPSTGLGIGAAAQAPRPAPVASINPPKPPVAKPPAAAAPAATAPTPAAPTTPFKAPETTAGAGIRSGAQTTYDAALRTGRQGIVQAALRLGSPEVINALKADPNFAEYVASLDKGSADPTSLFAQSNYNEGIGLNDVDQNANAGNTFFSSKRADDRGKLETQYNNANSGYLSDYNTNYNTLMGSMGTAFGQYKTDMSGADTEDLNQYLATTPQPSAAAPAAATPPPPTIPGMSPAQVSSAVAFLNNPNFGKDAEWNIQPKIQPGKDSKGNVGEWHIYPDGHKVFVRKG